MISAFVLLVIIGGYTDRSAAAVAIDFPDHVSCERAAAEVVKSSTADLHRSAICLQRFIH